MIMSDKSFRIVTLGCKVNQYESAYLKESLMQAGWCPAPEGDSTEMTIINTCIVTQRASHQSRQAIRKAIRENPSGMTAAIGCYAQVFPDELSQIEGIGLIAGNADKARLPTILGGDQDSCRSCVLNRDYGEETPFDFLPIKRFPGRTRAFLKIQDGCESFCSYCIVPIARGPLRSLDPDNVIRMLNSLSGEGFKEVVLTGIHLGKYGIDLDESTDLTGLLRQVGKERLPMRIRLSSLEPNEIGGELIEMMASEEWLCRHFHIPLQSGDDKILERMNRDYTSAEFADLIERIHKRIPLAAIGVDVMAGFPGEDDHAHQNSCSLVNDLPVSYLHVFPFSPRKGTPAADFIGQVNQKLVKERAGELRDAGKRKREAFYRSCLGKEFSVLVEGWKSEEKAMVKGLSDNYLPVGFPSSRLIENDMVEVQIQDVRDGSIIGRKIRDRGNA